jgi:hypothetical protein
MLYHLFTVYIYFAETDKKTKRGSNINKRQKELLVEFFPKSLSFIKGQIHLNVYPSKAQTVVGGNCVSVERNS